MFPDRFMGPGSYSWRRTFVFLPRKSIGGTWIFCDIAYKRKIWISYGFAPEPEVEYATLLEVLMYD